MPRYIIATKRQFRDKVAPGWQQELQRLNGVEIIGDQNSDTIQVEAPANAIQDIKALLGDRYFVEESTSHSKS